MSLSRELHEALGGCWHEPILGSQIWLITSNRMSFICSKCGERYTEDFCPDYVADPRLVIREIAKQGSMLDEKLKAFSMYVESGTHSKPYCISAHGLFELVAIDTTGKLARLALDWLQKEG